MIDNYLNRRIFSFSFTFFLTIFLSYVDAFAISPSKLYVWDFGTRENLRNEQTKNFTVEFEEAMIQTNCFPILERRSYDRLMSQKNNEKAIMAVEGISDFSLKNLKALEATGVIFGEVYDDKQSGEIKVTAIVQAFDGRNLAVRSIRFTRGKLFDAASREKNMLELAQVICASLNSVVSPETNSNSDSTTQPAPNIITFEAEPANLLFGQSATLRWLTSNTASVKITGSRGTSLFYHTASGSHVITPSSSETFLLVAKNDEGRSVQQTLVVSVSIPCEGHTITKTFLRNRPGAFTREQIQNNVLQRGFREYDWNPNGNFHNLFEVYGMVVVDCATGLMWQRYGSDHKIWTWNTASNYITRINAESYAGFRDWRLPTIEELASLLEPNRNSRGLYISDNFDEKDGFWSSDDWIGTAGTPVAWSANFDYGGIFHGGAKTNRFFVRAVRSIE